MCVFLCACVSARVRTHVKVNRTSSLQAGKWQLLHTDVIKSILFYSLSWFNYLFPIILNTCMCAAHSSVIWAGATCNWQYGVVLQVVTFIVLVNKMQKLPKVTQVRSLKVFKTGVLNLVQMGWELAKLPKGQPKHKCILSSDFSAANLGWEHTSHHMNSSMTTPRLFMRSAARLHCVILGSHRSRISSGYYTSTK